MTAAVPIASLFQGDDRFEYFIVLRKSMGGFFGKNQFAVDHDFKCAATRFDQLRLDPKLFFERGSQTDCLRIVVSNNAIFYRNIQALPRLNFI